MNDTESADNTVSTECGHEAPREATVHIPEVGRVCRECHTPIPLRQWKTVIDEQSTQHQTGDISHYSTWLVGLDEVGRGIYFDEYKDKVITLIPKYHPDFQDDVDGDEQPFRKRPPKFGGGPGKIVNAPDNGVLVVHNQVSFRTGAISSRKLSAWVAEEATNTTWSALSEHALELLEHHADCYDKAYYNDDTYPVAEARELVKEFRDD
ncbi:hypothetical protein [Halobacterium salinarum]|uniref:Uncharacterized protein n=1 Tax=Halobacterium salinarum (strain ATCC 33171 / DSM 3754 / JCM 8978 / NBRC 102687 / NCIMB 764 / 91-R6) TaxID=2597657 RepID=A0A4D6GSC6_HALS9|nr:hypothetical protein [Halobacterium salinarum]QCC44583.1 uncharacterized protein HBSAL_04335 [Halobacterium salinarum]TYO71628.1 hypothetical protein APQ99_02429 [Halobacterium salinarum DSM 3754]